MNILINIYCVLFMGIVVSNALRADEDNRKNTIHSDVDLFVLETERLYPGQFLNLEHKRGLLSLYAREYPKVVKRGAPVNYNVRFRVLEYVDGEFKFFGQEKLKSMQDWKEFKDYTDGYFQQNLFTLEQEIYQNTFMLKDGRVVSIMTTKVVRSKQVSKVQLNIEGASQKISTMGILHYADVYELNGHSKLLLAATYCRGGRRCSDYLTVYDIPNMNKVATFQANFSQVIE